MNRITAIFLSVVCLLSFTAGALAQSSTLYETEYLFPGQKLVAPSCYYELVMQSDGNLVTYGNASTGGGGAAWNSGTQNSGGYATLQTDGNFVIYNWSDQAVWATNTANWGYDKLVQQDDGNLVLYNLSNQAFWASGVSGEAIGQTPCETRAVVTEVNVDYDYPGADYTHFTIPVARASWCGYYCSQDSQCQVYTYVPPGVQGPSAVCWLKTGITQYRYSPGMVSGYKVWN